jgi:hypothetical protein
MEFLTGKSLNAFIGSQELDLEDRVEIVRQVAIALGAAHEGQGIGKPLIHLDLKPEHIFVEKIRGKWHVKVIDFGIAEIASAPSTDGANGAEERRVAGTLPYMAPERWKYVVDPRCDIYSLGIVLYELVAGRKPFQAADPKAMRNLHETVRPTPPSTHRSGPRTPALQELDALILRCLEKDPGRRPQTAQELVEGIEVWQARPRLTRGQRVRRAVALPMLTLLLVLLGLYWAPWESVRVPLNSGMILGPNHPLRLEPMVMGLGYEGHEATLLIAGKKIPLEQFQLDWDGLDDLAPAAECERRVSARLRVTGKLGRSLVSDPFEFKVDSRGPVIAEPSGALEVIEEGGRKTLWMLGTKFTVTALEELKEGGCDLNGDKGGTYSADRKSITFRTPRGERNFVLTLTDVAGNPAVKEWGDVHWVQEPRLVSDTRLFIKDSEHTLKLRVTGDCGLLTADGDRLEPVGPPEDGVTTFLKPVSFTDQHGAPAQRVVEVQLWSTFSIKKQRERDYAIAVSIEYHPRALRVQAAPGGNSAVPRQFTVVDDGENEIPNEELTWKEPQLLINDGSNVRLAETVLPLTPAGRLDGTEGIEALRQKGQLILIISASDRYENQASWMKLLPYGALPEIMEFGLASFDGPGSEARKLLHPDCTLRDNTSNRSALSLRAQVVYPFPTEAELWVGTPDWPPGDGVPTKLIDGLCVFEEEKLLQHLEAGPQEIFLAVTSKDLPSLRSVSRAVVHCAEPLDLIGLPEYDQVVSGDRVRIELSSRSGPKVTRITATAGGKAFPGCEAEGRQVVEVPVDPWGWTAVTIEIEFDGAWKLERSIRYRREPAPGDVYTFSAGEIAGKVQLEHHRDPLSGSSSWFTTRRSWKSLSSQFRRSSREKRWSAQERSQYGVSLEEAREIARWLTIEARTAGLLGAGEEFTLPSLEQVGAIADRIEPGEELWLRNVPRELPETEAATAKKYPDGQLRPRRALLRDDPFAFRLVVIERGKSALHPGSASGARKVTQRGKP